MSVRIFRRVINEENEKDGRNFLTLKKAKNSGKLSGQGVINFDMESSVRQVIKNELSEIRREIFFS